MVASRRSGDMRTSGIVTTCAVKTSSWTSPRVSISANAWRMSSATRSWRCVGPLLLWARRWAMPDWVADWRVGALPGPTPYRNVLSNGVRGGSTPSQRTRNGLDVEALHDVANADILIVGDRHAALLSGRHFAYLVLEALQSRQRALVDHHVVADEAHLGAALHLAVGDAAAGDLADLGNVEHLQDFRIAKVHLAHRRRQQAGHGLSHVVDQIVDDVVVADLDPGLVGRELRLRVGTHIEAHHHRARGAGQRHIRFGDAADARVHDTCLDLVVAEFAQSAADGLHRSLHIALDQQRELLAASLLQLLHHLLEGARRTGGAQRLAALAQAIIGELART